MAAGYRSTEWFDVKGGVQLEESSIDLKVCLLGSHFKCMEMRRLVSRMSNSSSFVSWLLESMMLGHTSMVVSIWPHPSVTRPSEVRRDWHSSWTPLELGERLCVSVSSKRRACFSLFSSVLVSMVAMPTGYEIVISRTLGMHGIYCPQPSGTRLLCFSAINAIHPSRPWYNYYLITQYIKINVSTFLTLGTCAESFWSVHYHPSYRIPRLQVQFAVL